jgi:hypothetical protein
LQGNLINYLGVSSVLPLTNKNILLIDNQWSAYPVRLKCVKIFFETNQGVELSTILKSWNPDWVNTTEQQRLPKESNNYNNNKEKKTQAGWIGTSTHAKLKLKEKNNFGR